jgi:predicted Zn finger-like uncharacterized protein
MELPVSIPCPSCKARLKIKQAALLGKTVKCPKCGESFAAEAPDEQGNDARDVPEVPVMTPPLPASRGKSKPAGADSKSAPPAPTLPTSASQPVSPVSAPALTAPTAAGEPPARWPRVDTLWYAGTVAFALLLIAGLAVFSSFRDLAIGIENTQRQQQMRVRPR